MPKLKLVHRIVVLSVAGFVVSCAGSLPANPRAVPLHVGDSKQTAIEVCMPAGERAYLARLVCPNGQAVGFRRIGNFGQRTPFPDNLSEEQQRALFDKVISGEPFGVDEPDYHVVDAYDVTCGEDRRTIYMDMYHCKAAPPTVAPAGFRLR